MRARKLKRIIVLFTLLLSATRIEAFPANLTDDNKIEIKKHQTTHSPKGETIHAFIRGQGNVLTVGVGGLPAGVYAYRIYNAENTVLQGKFVKE